MKIKLIVTALSLCLVACSNIQINELPVQAITSPVKAASAQGSKSVNIITLKKIMADPDWMGRSPESWYWGNNNRVHYQQKQQGNPLRNLYEVNLDTHKTIQVTLANQHKVADKGASIDPTKNYKVYAFNGDTFVKTIATEQLKQLTFTSEQERKPKFLNNGRVAYQIGHSFFSHDIRSGQIKELAKLELIDKPKASKQPETYLATEQQKLINYIALQQRNIELTQAQQQRLNNANNAVNDPRFYLG